VLTSNKNVYLSMT